MEVSRDSHQWIWLEVGAGGGVAKVPRAFFLMIGWRAFSLFKLSLPRDEPAGGGFVDQQPLLVEVSGDSHQWIWLEVGAGGGVTKGRRNFLLVIGWRAFSLFKLSLPRDEPAGGGVTKGPRSFFLIIGGRSRCQTFAPTG